MTALARGLVLGTFLTILAYFVNGVPAANAEILNNEPFDWTSSNSIGDVGFCNYTGGPGSGVENYVRAVQLLMWADGQYGPGTIRPGSIDGWWGNMSHQGMRGWQSTHGNLAIDGCFGNSSANHAQGGTPSGHPNHLTPNSGYGGYVYDGTSHNRSYGTFAGGDGRGWEQAWNGFWFSYAGCSPAGLNCALF
jgi:hypothetical protein